MFFALQGCETQVKCTFWRFSGYHSIWVALTTFRYSMKKKVSWWARPPTWPCWLPFGGRFFFFLVTFKLPFHALPLLSPHPASFRSFTPGGLKFVVGIVSCMVRRGFPCRIKRIRGRPFIHVVEFSVFRTNQPVGHPGLQLKIPKDVKPLEYDDQLFEQLACKNESSDLLSNKLQRHNTAYFTKFARFC